MDASIASLNGRLTGAALAQAVALREQQRAQGNAAYDAQIAQCNSTTSIP